MTEILKNTLQEVLNEVLAPCNKVKEIFENYFGEDKVELFIPYYYTGNENSLFVQEFTHYLGVDIEDEDAAINVLHECFLDLDENEKLRILNGFHSIQNFELTIYFPEVKITNENGNSTNIKNLFVRFEITLDGKLKEYIKLLRSHYTYAHFKNNYMHSHVSNIPLSNITEFQSCCTGSGPINRTMANLHNNFDEAQWLQFCWDIDKYVQVESLIGVPYHKLIDADCEVAANIEFKRYHTGTSLSYIDYPLRKDFLKYIIESSKINFRWVRNNWEIAHSLSEFTCIVSKLFLQWVKEINAITDYSHFINALTVCVIYKSTGLYVANGYRDNLNYLDSFVGKEIVNFKGISFVGEVDAPINQEISLKVLKPDVVKDIWCLLTNILNNHYGRKTNEVFSEGQ